MSRVDVTISDLEHPITHFLGRGGDFGDDPRIYLRKRSSAYSAVEPRTPWYKREKHLRYGLQEATCISELARKVGILRSLLCAKKELTENGMIRR